MERGRLLSLLALGATVALAPAASWAAQSDIYLGWGSPGTPGFTEEKYVAYGHSDGSNAIDDLAYLLYYTHTGLTGTTRDRFEFWTGLDAGYQNTRGGRSAADGFGVAIPNVGVEYYDNVERPRVPAGRDGFETFWVSPEFELNFPNGDDRPAGFGAGQNAFSVGGMLEAYYQRGRFALTVEPVGFSYGFDSLTARSSTELATSLRLRRNRGGLSSTLGVFAPGWQVAPDFFAGLFHSWNVYSFAGTDRARGSEGTLGPTFSYAACSDRPGSCSISPCRPTTSIRAGSRRPRPWACSRHGISDRGRLPAGAVAWDAIVDVA